MVNRSIRWRFFDNSPFAKRSLDNLPAANGGGWIGVVIIGNYYSVVSNFLLAESVADFTDDSEKT